MMLPAAVQLQTYTSGRATSGRVETSLLSLVRDTMPPLEDLVIGGQPTSIGLPSAIAIAIGGLVLLYRGLIDFRIPLYMLISAIVALLILPIPIRIGQESVLWQWMAFHRHGVGLPLAVTFANYELLASPLLFTAFFLATAAAARPMTRRARTIYAPIIGALAVVLQLYASALIGPYVAVLIASLLTPTFDSVFHPRTLV
jgi:Na+-translocating ferredoxin:NAD+ oxidoreductase subunit D